jgi:multiple sugar transport system ATP-binding protein
MMLAVSQLTVTTTRGRRLVENVEFNIGSGEIMAIFGPSGCGKSTLLNAIAGFIEFSDTEVNAKNSGFGRRWFAANGEKLTGTGRIVIDGSEVTRWLPEQRSVGLVLQRFGVYPNLTGRDNIAFPLQCRGISQAESAAIVERAAQMAGVDPTHLAQRVKTLSGGEAQRIAIAKMLAKRARVALMDEPFSHLDQLRRSDLTDLLRRIVGAETDGAMDAVVLVSHDWRELRLADKLLLLNARSDGQLASRVFTRERSTGMFSFELPEKSLPPDNQELRWIEGLKEAAQ